jgi:hypothetical protein
MDRKCAVTFSVVVGHLLVLATCTGRYQDPFLVVQMCMPREKADFDDLANILGRVATSHDMRFLNSSERITREVQQLNSPVVPGPVVEMSVRGKDWFMISAGNLVGRRNQAHVFFFAGSNLTKSQEIADSMLNELRIRWDVHIIPDSGEGLHPLDCQ